MVNSQPSGPQSAGLSVLTQWPRASPDAMTCFSGCFSSLPGVRCDRFNSLKSEGSLVAADQFFLSHVHCDHMVRTCKHLKHFSISLARTLRLDWTFLPSSVRRNPMGAELITSCTAPKYQNNSFSRSIPCSQRR